MQQYLNEYYIEDLSNIIISYIGKPYVWISEHTKQGKIDSDILKMKCTQIITYLNETLDYHDVESFKRIFYHCNINSLKGYLCFYDKTQALKDWPVKMTEIGEIEIASRIILLNSKQDKYNTTKTIAKMIEKGYTEHVLDITYNKYEQCNPIHLYFLSVKFGNERLSSHFSVGNDCTEDLTCMRLKASYIDKFLYYIPFLLEEGRYQDVEKSLIFILQTPTLGLTRF